ncbi:hypothetical protein CC86DRAFT_405583 [Ophiobolus disseminans]|uniref:RING-type domain-containing protein n=1 Tax=Ophiobolus disseminans TaxID=1469910 RepID=A0A6A7A3R4_9PLEO|nr:hypothetical protein CC86DRAFT_405583 [Ophiobolus disseminans]
MSHQLRLGERITQIKTPGIPHMFMVHEDFLCTTSKWCKTQLQATREPIEDSECSVCHTTFRPLDTVVFCRAKCGKNFHKECVYEWKWRHMANSEEFEDHGAGDDDETQTDREFARAQLGMNPIDAGLVNATPEPPDPPGSPVNSDEASDILSGPVIRIQLDTPHGIYTVHEDVILSSSRYIKQRHPRRKLMQGECLICHEDMESHENLIWCQGGCGQNYHDSCMQEWIATSGKNIYPEDVPCPYCREP